MTEPARIDRGKRRHCERCGAYQRRLARRWHAPTGQYRYVCPNGCVPIQPTKVAPIHIGATLQEIFGESAQ